MGIKRDTFAKSATSSRSTETLTQEFGQLHVLDDLIRLRAKDDIQTPILAYPSCNGEAASYTYYNGQQMDRMIDETAKRLMEDGFRSVRP